MSAFRSSIRAALAVSTLVFAAWGQDVETVGLPTSSGSFRLAPGTSFSASARKPERKPKLSPALRRIADDFDEALEVIAARHASAPTADAGQRFSSAVNGMLRELDPHSAYYTAKDFKTLNDDHRGRYFGIGMSIAEFARDNRVGVYVLSVKNGSPAAQAGIKFGDRIVGVNGADVKDLDSETVRDMIRGPEGSVASIRVERWGVAGPMDLRIRRATVPEPSIPAAFVISDGVGYIALTEGFTYTTAEEFEEAMRRLRTLRVRSLIVDLRGNGGGLMEQSVRIAEMFLPAGRVIVSQHSRDPRDERISISRNRRPETLPLVLLVDDNTASASEIFAAAMQDNDRATIVGTRTFGKGLVQDVIPLADGSGLVLTSERYYAPSGRSIQRDYSDGGLYDYFRHITKGTLVDQPSYAAKTLKGRTVYGGDGIAPDVLAAGPAWTDSDLRDYENAFFLTRENVVLQNSVSGGVERHLRSFRALAKDGENAAREISLANDPQVKAAIAAAASAFK